MVAFPLAMVAAVLPLRLFGAPRWVYNPLARTQQPWLVVVHTARLGGDLMTTAVLATASTSVALAAGWLPRGGGGRDQLRGGDAGVRLGEPEARHGPGRAR